MPSYRFGGQKWFFFNLLGYQNPILDKIIFELSPIQKSWCDQTRRLASILEFCSFSRSPHNKFRWHFGQNPPVNIIMRMYAKVHAWVQRENSSPFFKYSLPTSNIDSNLLQCTIQFFEDQSTLLILLILAARRA